MMFAVSPDVLDRIQFRRIGWQVFRFEAAFLIADELLGLPAAMRRKPIPDQEDVAVNVAKQVPEEFNDLPGLYGLLEYLKVEVPDSDAGDDGERFPVEMELKNRRLPARRPCASPMGPLAQAAFVEEDDRAALFLSFFLISGQRLFFQSAISASLRSSARPTGCCTLQFSCRNIFQMCPG